MSKNKLQHFAEMKTFTNLFQPSAKQMYESDFELKGKWNDKYFRNSNPLVLELGCGKGEYTIGLAKKYLDSNFVGIDIKGARLWTGSKIATDENMTNVAFIRNKVEFINSFYNKNEVDEIWITFPDPQIEKSKKRLTSSRFLNLYSEILKPKGIIHLKTDSILLHKYTLKIIKQNNLELIFSSDDLYNSEYNNDILSIRTYYEQKYLDKGIKTTYLKFKLNNKTSFEEPYNIGLS